MGRPSSYTPEIAQAICERLAEGESLRSICRDESMPADSTVRLWAVNDVGGFSAQYTRAREAQAHHMADELLEIADDGRNDWMERHRADGTIESILNAEHVQRSRLRTDTRKWLLSKMLPKVYGDRMHQEHTGADGAPIAVAATITAGIPLDVSGLSDEDLAKRYREAVGGGTPEKK